MAGLIIGGAAGSYVTKKSFERVSRNQKLNHPTIDTEDDFESAGAECLHKIQQVENNLLVQTNDYKDAYNTLYKSHELLKDGKLKLCFSFNYSMHSYYTLYYTLYYIIF